MTDKPKTRWCSRGDTICTVQPLNHNGRNLYVTCTKAEACAEANNLIAAGRWRVSRCGRCEKPVEDCECEK